MPTSRERLTEIHSGSETHDPLAKELAGELLKAQEALDIARDLAQLGPVLKSAIGMMQLEGASRESLRLAVISKNPDGSGKVGPEWELGEFASDLEKLSKLVHDDEEQMDLTAAGLVAIFGGGRGVG